MNRVLLFAVAAILSAVVMCGCAAPRISETGRTAVEQFLLSTVVEGGIRSADFKPYEGKKMFIEYDYLAPQVDKPYVQGVFEMHLAAQGVIVTRDIKDADLLVQILCGVLATDTTKFTIGTPMLPIPVPDTSINIAIPEMSLYQKLTRSGYGKFGFSVLDGKTRKPVKVMPNVLARTSYTNWVFFLIPFRSHDMQLDIKEAEDSGIQFDMM